ncbi:MAG TPA: hypothetical protein VH111_12575 [Steroidobacteraceae bacterium]|jgi:hypothetical protein|nr:hypothetical protein [Steroidobacteraceae bacterium]
MLPDDLDADLLRRFAESRAALDGAQFTERVTRGLRRARSARLGFRTVRSIVAAMLTGLATGIAAPLRLRHAGLLALAAAAVTLWTGLQGL